jgi:Fe-S cluster biosynthesis and repair protein YggX
MRRTTIELEDEIYKKLAREALERYWSRRKLFLLINEKLKEISSLKKMERDALQ